MTFDTFDVYLIFESDRIVAKCILMYAMQNLSAKVERNTYFLNMDATKKNVSFMAWDL